MSDISYEKLYEDLIRDEGERLKPYKDTVGKLTIGVGHNLTDKGIPLEVSRLLLAIDVTEAVRDLDHNTPWWRNMPEPAQRGLLNMCFNMGWPVLSEFKVTLGLLKNGKYTQAGKNAMKSLWAKQVGKRAERIRDLFIEADHGHSDS